MVTLTETFSVPKQLKNPKLLSTLLTEALALILAFTTSLTDILSLVESI